MGVTLHDVCRRSRVSTATVSRVLNQSALVTPTTRDRVLTAMRELDYHPSTAARALASARTRTLAVLFPAIASGFYAEVLCGMDEVASEHQYHLLVAFSHGPQDEERLFIQCLRERRADALIALNMTLPDELARTASRQNTPVVLVGHPIAGAHLAAVSIDNAHGTRSAVAHLVEHHGHRRIAFLTGPRGSYDATQRLAAFRQALQENDVPLERELIWPGAFTEESGRTALARWLQTGRPLPDAIFAANDPMAIGALAALREHGARVPADVALVGFDDCESARHLDLTTVRVPMRQMGRLAIETAIAQITKPKPAPARRIVPTTLTIRRSCGCAPGGMHS